MASHEQRERAERLRALHHASQPLVLPNAWDAASARMIEQVGFPVVATTSSGVAAALGYDDGQHIGRELLIEALARITRVVSCPVTADIEAGYGATPEEVLQTVREVIATGVVGINIEDSLKQGTKALVDTSSQVELIQAIRELANSLDVPLVINARVDVLLLEIGEPEGRLEHTIQRAKAYLQAGADCVYPIGYLDRATIAGLVKTINGPINILSGASLLTIPELAALGVARVSLAGGMLRSVLGHIRAVAQELLTKGTYEKMQAEALTSAQLHTLFADQK